MAARTDLVAFVPRRLIAALWKPLGLMAVAPPPERELLDCGMSRTEIEYELRRPRRRK